MAMAPNKQRTFLRSAGAATEEEDIWRLRWSVFVLLSAGGTVRVVQHTDSTTICYNNVYH